MSIFPTTVPTPERFVPIRSPGYRRFRLKQAASLVFLRGKSKMIYFDNLLEVLKLPSEDD